MKGILSAIIFIISGNLIFAQTTLKYRVTPWPENKKAAVTVTLDDDCDGQFTYGVPIMNARNIKGTFFVITGDGAACNGSVDWPAFRNAASFGHEVTAHTVTHPDLTTLSNTQINAEMQNSQNAIIQMVPGQRSQTFAYPYGAGGGGAAVEVNVRTIAHNYFIGARGAGVNPSGFDEYNDYRSTAFQDYYFQVESYEITPSVDITTFKNILNAVVIDGGWFIPQYHGIQTSGFDLITSAAFTAQMDALSAKSSSLWLGTFAQTLKYHKEHDSHKLEVISENTSAWTLNLSDNLPNASFDQPLTVRMKAPLWAYTSITQGTKTLSVITDGDTLQFNAVPDGGNIIFNKGIAGPVIATNAITGTSFCAGAPVVVPFTVSGTYNSDNIFTAQLSSSTGSFTSPVNIGTRSGTASSSISANIPANTVAGNSYRIRVVSSSPVVTGSDNGTNLIINAVPVPAISSPSTTFCAGGSVTLSANTGTGLSYQWIKDGTNISGATASTYPASIAGTYTVKETNSSGCSTVSGGISITQSATCTTIVTNTIIGSPFCKGAQVVIPFTVSGTYNSGNIFTAQLSSSSGSFTNPVNLGSLAGTTSGSISAKIPTNSSSGNAYRIRVVSSSPVITGIDNGTNISINSNTVPIANISSPSTTICGNTVTLTANTGRRLTYQWIKDGVNISGAINSTYTASVAGIYKVRVTNTSGCFLVSEEITITQSTNCSNQAQTITFPAIPNKTYTPVPFKVIATASSGLPVSFSIVSGPAIVSNDTIKITGVGTVVVRASQAGNASFNPAPNVDRSFTVSQASQSIIFPVIPNKQLTDPPFTVNASASSGLPITFSIVSGPATISGNTVTLAGTGGTVTVRATQAGNVNYLSATATTSFSVGKLSQTINFPQIPDHEALDDPFQLHATASSGLPVTFEILYGPADIEGDNYVYLWEYAGVVGVRATQAGNAQYAAVHVDQEFREYVGTPRQGYDSLLSKTAPMVQYSVYPNPAHDILKIRFDKGENIDGYTFSLQSGTGETIDGIEFIPDKVLNEVDVDIRLLASGIYYLFIYDGKKTRVNKILKE